jgi:ATP-dependent Clp protease ATP-binding subunit ClpA
MNTLLGYHNKNKGQYTIMETEKLPMLVDDEYEPFIMTPKQFFTEKTYRIEEELRKIPIQRAIKKFKNTLATILIIPGTISAIIYTLEFLSETSQKEFLPISIPSWLTNFTFWLAIWGVIILWHETYKQINKRKTLLSPQPFSDHDLQSIRQGDLGFAKLSRHNSWQMLSQESKNLIYNSLDKGQFDVYKMLIAGANSKEGQVIMDRLNINNFKNSLRENEINPNTIPDYPISAIRSILCYATEEAIITESNMVDPAHIFIALFKVFPILQRYLRRNRQNIDLIRYVVKWLNLKDKRMRMTRTFDPNVPYTRSGGIANNWIYGYTYVLNHYSTDLNQKMAKINEKFGIGHEEQMKQAISILSKMTKNNILFIGEGGTGKTSMVKGLANLINHKKVPPNLFDMRIIQLDINGLIAGATQHGNIESLVQKTMSELQKAGNTVLFIDEIQELIPTKGQESQHSLAGIFLPYILESNFPIIGTITYTDYKKYFHDQDSLRQSFNTVEINEVSTDAAFNIILTILDKMERKYNIRISFPAILTAIELAQRYIYDRKLPDSAVNVIETACAGSTHSQKDILTTDDVAEVVSQQTNIPVTDVSTDEATELLNLEKRMKNKVIGQDEAVHQVVEALKRARVDVQDPNKPVGTFLFLGPTGVGKTYLAQTLNKEYFSESSKLIRMDMSEFKELADIQKILGYNDAQAGHATTLLDRVKRNPFATILLDEIEKAHPQVLDLFLQLLDEGRLTSSNGETVNFNNTIIIATSNIGSKQLLDTLEKDHEMFEAAKEKVLDKLRNEVRVEFLNRFDKIIVFSPHDMENLTKISVLLLKELKARLVEKDIIIEWKQDVPSIIAQQAYEPGLGARPLRRYIQDTIEGAIATKMLKKEIIPGDNFVITSDLLPKTKNPNTPSQQSTQKSKSPDKNKKTIQQNSQNKPQPSKPPAQNHPPNSPTAQHKAEKTPSTPQPRSSTQTTKPTPQTLQQNAQTTSTSKRPTLSHNH